MIIKIPMNLKRVAAAFDEIPMVVKSCESSGSEHSADLSDLVNSFLERETREEMRAKESSVDHDSDVGDDEVDDDEMGSSSFHDVESRDILKKIFSHEDDAVRKSIQEEVQKAYGEANGSLTSTPDFKRRLMAQLRSRGFDAGICKSKWEKNGQCPSGSYEYIDVQAGEIRYIIEISLAGEFTIARPTAGYASLLETFPQIYVGRAEEVKKVVRVICKAIRRSMKSAGMHVPPWRRHAYTQLKWFASYKRTTNEVAGGGRLQMQRVVVGLGCRGVEFGVRMGNLAAVLNGKEMTML